MLSDQASRPRALPLVDLPAAVGPPGSSVGVSAQPLLATAAALPVSLLPKVVEIVGSADGVELEMSDGVTAIVGNEEALAEKFVSLATVLQARPADRHRRGRPARPRRSGLDPPGQRLYRSRKG